jgi:hypothetical protein
MNEWFFFAICITNTSLHATTHSDSDSGLGRVTPRRAASPGMGSSSSSSRHLPSPSGPGSLPHPSLMTKRRVVGYDDGASDISSTPSSIFGDYNGNFLHCLKCVV